MVMAVRTTVHIYIQRKKIHVLHQTEVRASDFAVSVFAGTAQTDIVIINNALHAGCVLGLVAGSAVPFHMSVCARLAICSPNRFSSHEGVW